MFDKLNDVESRFEQLNIQLQDPDVTGNQEKYRNLMKEYSDLEPVVKTFREYKNTKQGILDNKEMLDTEKDEEMRELAKEELSELQDKIPGLEQELKLLLLPKDPNDEKNIILELRAGAGGDEASLFAGELFRAYSMYAQEKGWRVETLSASEGTAGGFKEISATITGEKVYSRLKYESGVHRVQRVPKTESQGRVHTSTITVAILPEAEEVDVDIKDADLRIDVFRASGAGGQHVNTTDSAVRITHLPTGTVVSCQDEKSQHKNKAKAMKVLYARILQVQQEEAAKENSDLRSAQVGTGDRSERIRTYNFPQSRVTDHRIGLTLHSLGEVMEGAMDQVVEPVITHYQSEALKAQQ